jgi:diadenosine tetraphosphate (Ap4A) HIT family hydrolase
MNGSCPLCGENLSSAGEAVVDFGDWKFLLHRDSAVLGHAMLVIARHVENFADLTDSEAQQFARVHKVVERALLDVTRCERAILTKFGIAVPHLHIHIYPVSAKLTRADVMRIINAEVSEQRPPEFAKTLRDRVMRLT